MRSGADMRGWRWGLQVTSFARKHDMDADDAIRVVVLYSARVKSSVTVSKSPERDKRRAVISPSRPEPSLPHRWLYSRLPSDVSIMFRPKFVFRNSSRNMDRGNSFACDVTADQHSIKYSQI